MWKFLSGLWQFLVGLDEGVLIIFMFLFCCVCGIAMSGVVELVKALTNK